jgi:hypothetical protein
MKGRRRNLKGIAKVLLFVSILQIISISSIGATEYPSDCTPSDECYSLTEPQFLAIEPYAMQLNHMLCN